MTPAKRYLAEDLLQRFGQRISAVYFTAQEAADAAEVLSILAAERDALRAEVEKLRKIVEYVETFHPDCLPLEAP